MVGETNRVLHKRRLLVLAGPTQVMDPFATVGPIARLVALCAVRANGVDDSIAFSGTVRHLQ